MTLRILVADDNATTHKMIRLAFGGENAVIETVTSGDAALEVLKQFHPHIVLANVSMSGYNGYEVCELIRQEPDFVNTPVILMLGAFDPFDEDEAARVQASGHLTKPFDPSEMLALIEKLLPAELLTEEAAPAGAENELDATAAAASAPEENDAAETAPTIPAPTGNDWTGDANLVGADATTETNAPVPPIPSIVPIPPANLRINPRVWQSFLGQEQILEILDENTVTRQVTLEEMLPEALLDRIAEKVVERMFPEIAALIIQTLDKNNE